MTTKNSYKWIKNPLYGGENVIDVKTLEEYYRLKCEEKVLKRQISILRNEIIDGLYEMDIEVYAIAGYTAEIKYLHQTTSAFVDFLKQTNNSGLIKETASCKVYEKMKNIYNFSDEEEECYYELKKEPYLYVKKANHD